MMKGQYDDQADYAKPDRFNGGFGGLRGRVPLFRLNVPREKGSAYVRSPLAAAIWTSLVDGTATSFPDYYLNTLALEAFRCLIEDDRAGGEACAKAVITALRLEQAERDAKRREELAKNPAKPQPPVAQPAGGFQLAFAYDFLHGVMTPAQRQEIQAELAATTWSHDNYGTFNTAEGSRSNWATFSYWLYQVLAIEGEPGFNDLKVRGMYRGWRNLLTYGWFASGATYEGEAKNQLGMDGILMFAQRAKAYGFENLAGHPYLQAYARNFLPHSSNPMLTGFHRYDLLGGSRAANGAAAPMDVLGLKYCFPNDRRIDWYYRQAIGEDYRNVPDRPDGYFNALLFYAIFATDYDAGPNDAKDLNLGMTFFCGERALLMTRSAWDPDAMQLNLHVRQVNGGHPFADRNAVMVAGAGRIWSPNGYASFRTFENSVVSIDGLSQSENSPGRLVAMEDHPQATFAIGDAKYAWDWDHRTANAPKGFYRVEDLKAGKVEIPPGCEPVTLSVNDFAFTKLPFAYLDRPLTEAPHWILPAGAISPVVREPRFPVQKAWRTAGLVRGPQPYAVVLDDLRVGDTEHRYDWTLALEYDVQIAAIDRRPDGITDVLLTGDDPNQTAKRPKEALPALREAPIPARQPVLLVRVLRGASAAADLTPTIIEAPNSANPKKYAPIRRLVIPTRAVEPGFQVVLLPHRQGDAVPTSTWDAARTTATVGEDRLRFTPGALGKTDLTVTRGGATLVALTKPVTALRDPAAQAREERVAAIRRSLAGFDPDRLAGAVPLTLPADAARAPGRFSEALQFTADSTGVAVPVNLGQMPAFTVALWFRTEGAPAGSLLTAGSHRGLSLSIENGRSLRVDTCSTHRWVNQRLNFATWHQVLLVREGTATRLLIDGEEVKADTNLGQVGFPAALTLGGGGFTGLIEDLRVFDRALTPDEATRLYQATAHVLPGKR